MKPTDTLANGATVIAESNGIVLALRDHPYHPYVTWAHNGPDMTYWGHYHRTIWAAMDDFNGRVNRASGITYETVRSAA